MQVETIFTGSAAAMRRTTLPFIAQKLQENSPDDLKLLDFGCGTGCYLNEVKHNWPNLNVTGLDLLQPMWVRRAHVLANIVMLILLMRRQKIPDYPPDLTT